MRRMGWYPVATRVIPYPVMLREETHRTATVCPGQCQVFAFRVVRYIDPGPDRLDVSL